MKEVTEVEQELIIIVGAGSHARVVLDVVLANNLQVLGFLDDRAMAALTRDINYLELLRCWKIYWTATRILTS